MKKQFLKFGVAAMLVLGASTLVVSCSSSAEEAANALEDLEKEMEKKSEKGNWTEEDKARFHEELDEEAKANLRTMLGDNTDSFIACYLENIEENYENFDSANSDMTGMQQIATDCMKEHMPMMEDMMSEEETGEEATK